MTSEPTSGPQHSWRLRVYPLALLAALAAALLLAVLTYDRNDPTTRLGGDYPSFYAAGSIALAGDWDELYSAERQSKEQAGLIDDEGGYLYFSYPPFVAAAYSPLAALDYRLSFLLHTLLMTFALVAAIRLLWPWLESLGWPLPALLVLALAFYPLLRAVPGGQNTTLSILLISLAVRLERNEAPFWAGLALAGLLFKPQFGVVIVPLLLLTRRWRVLTGWIAGAGFLALLSTLLMGGMWLGDWWDQAAAFRDLNVAANGANFVSLPGFFENLFGTGDRAAFVIGYAGAAVFGLAVAYFWWRHPRSRPLERYALAAAAVVLAAPQTLYYDSGLLLIGLVAVAAVVKERGAIFVGALAALSWVHVAADDLGWSPLAPLAWAAAGLLAWQLNRRLGSQPTPV